MAKMRRHVLLQRKYGGKRAKTSRNERMVPLDKERGRTRVIVRRRKRMLPEAKERRQVGTKEWGEKLRAKERSHVRTKV